MNRFGKRFAKICSYLLTCTLMLPTVSSAFCAESSTNYDSINAADCKEVEVISLDEEDTDVPFNVFDIVEAHKDYVSQGPVPIYRKSHGIDVSQWQGEVDWSKVKEENVDFAIIRSGYGKLASQEDPTFKKNMKGAQEAGIQCGTYWYSYALNAQDAYEEALACYEIIKDYDFTYPVYFDIEDPSQLRLSAAQTSEIIEVFCSTLQDLGYYVGLYSYTNFLTTRVFKSVLEKYDIWVAHIYVDKPDYDGKYGMWQYTYEGSIDGINGDVDMNYCYLNYPYIISPDTYVEPCEEPDIPDVTPPAAAERPTGDILANGIDVSFWQGDVNWSKVKNAGYDFALIRAGYGNLISQKDPMFEKNMAGAEEAGLNRGVYWYSYAASPEDAVREAEVCYEIIKDYKLEFPVFFNIEDQSFDRKSAAEVSAITNAFCSYMESKGYYVGIQSYSNFLNNKMEQSVLDRYDVWVAHYGVSKPDYYGNFGMWQHSGSGMVDGVPGVVDLNYCYYDYPNIMKNCHLNGF